MIGAGPSTGERTIGNGRYALLQEIGWGGSGVVWRGEDRVIQRPVAIKEAIMSRNLPEQQREVAMRRTLREVRATGQLNHPAALTIHDVLWGDETGAVYIVMELVDGSSLTEVLKRTGPMRPRWAARVALDLLDALEAAHEAGIIHRDIKPSNIMLPSTHEAPAKLADFGLAWVNGDVSLTQSDTIVGSPSYLSPEQINGDPVTRRTDLWQLGVTLYDMVCGFSPFSRDDQQATLFAIIGSDPARPDCGEPLASTITELLNKRPEKRPTAAEVRQVLEQYAATARTSEHDTATHRHSRGAAWHSRRWRRPLLAAAVVLVVACAATGGTFLGRITATPANAVQTAGPSTVLSWDSHHSGAAQDENSMDMSKVDFERTGCLNGTLEPNQRVFETTCELPHSFEVFASFALPTTPDSAYPRGLAEAASTFCAASYDSYGRSSWLRGQNIRLTALPPSAPRWNSRSDFRNVVYCAVSSVDGGMMSESGLKNR